MPLPAHLIVIGTSAGGMPALTRLVALRMMEERKNLLSSLAAHGDGRRGTPPAARVEEIKRHINRLRKFLLAGSEGGPTPPAKAPARRAFW